MEPLLSTLPARTSHNEPHNLLARLYREIGISAVAAALQLSDGHAAGSDAAEPHTTEPHAADAVLDAQSQAATLLAAPSDKAA